MLPVAVAGVRVSIHNASGQGINVFPRSGTAVIVPNATDAAAYCGNNYAMTLTACSATQWYRTAYSPWAWSMGTWADRPWRQAGHGRQRSAAPPSPIRRSMTSSGRGPRCVPGARPCCLRTGDAREIPRHLRAELDLRRRLVMTLTLIREREDFAGSAL